MSVLDISRAFDILVSISSWRMRTSSLCHILIIRLIVSTTFNTGGGFFFPSFASCNCFSSITKRAGLTRSTGGRGASDVEGFKTLLFIDFFPSDILRFPSKFRLDTVLIGETILGLGLL